MQYDFIALDIETANEDLSSICQVALVFFSNSQVVRSWKSYVNPKDDFSCVNMEIHGITPEMVRRSPCIPDIVHHLIQELAGQIAVHHTFFDRLSLSRAAEKSALQMPDINFLDSSLVVKRVWEQYKHAGYALANLANDLHIAMPKHHDAESDAWTAGQVIIRAMKDTNTTPQDWIDRINKEKADQHRLWHDRVKMAGDGDGPLLGETVVFTGELSIPRVEAARLASVAGANVWDAVTKTTTILVVGDQDRKALRGKSKSSKHLKAESMISQGFNIRILRELDFIEAIKE